MSVSVLRLTFDCALKIKFYTFRSMLITASVRETFRITTLHMLSAFLFTRHGLERETGEYQKFKSHLVFAAKIRCTVLCARCHMPADVLSFFLLFQLLTLMQTSNEVWAFMKVKEFHQVLCHFRHKLKRSHSLQWLRGFSAYLQFVL